MDMETFVIVFVFLSLFGLNSSYRKHIYVKDKKSWDVAQDYCRTKYDRLSTVTSQDIQTFSQNSDDKEDFIYIGLRRDDQNTSKWNWSNGALATINDWDVGEGITIGEDCAAIRKSAMKLHDVGCNLELPFYCMLDLELILENKTWEESLNYCRQRYTGLASLSENTIMELAVEIAAEAQTVNIWTGLRFLAAHWFWVNGGTYNAYQAWSEEEEIGCPDINHRCGALDRDRKIWIPQNCQDRYNFICSNRRSK